MDRFISIEPHREPWNKATGPDGDRPKTQHTLPPPARGRSQPCINSTLPS